MVYSTSRVPIALWITWISSGCVISRYYKIKLKISTPGCGTQAGRVEKIRGAAAAPAGRVGTAGGAQHLRGGGGQGAGRGQGSNGGAI